MAVGGRSHRSGRGNTMLGLNVQPGRGPTQIRPFELADEEAVVALWQECELTRPWNRQPGKCAVWVDGAIVWLKLDRCASQRSARTASRSGGMADALDSKSSARKGVWVQVPPSVFLFSSTLASNARDSPARLWSTAADCGKLCRTRSSVAGRFVIGELTKEARRFIIEVFACGYLLRAVCFGVRVWISLNFCQPIHNFAAFV